MVQVLQSLRTSVTSSGNPLSEAEMDRHTLKGLREGRSMQSCTACWCTVTQFTAGQLLWWRLESVPYAIRHRAFAHMQQIQVLHCSRRLDAGAKQVSSPHLTLLDGCAGAAGDGAPKPLVFVRPSDPLQLLVQRLFSERCHMAPVIDGDPQGESLARTAICKTHLPSWTLCRTALLCWHFSAIASHLVKVFSVGARSSLCHSSCVSSAALKLPLRPSSDVSIADDTGSCVVFSSRPAGVSTVACFSNSLQAA
jgi:hypothetical protein